MLLIAIMRCPVTARRICLAKIAIFLISSISKTVQPLLNMETKLQQNGMNKKLKRKKDKKKNKHNKKKDSPSAITNKKSP